MPTDRIKPGDADRMVWAVWPYPLITLCNGTACSGGYRLTDGDPEEHWQPLDTSSFWRYLLRRLQERRWREWREWWGLPDALVGWVAAGTLQTSGHNGRGVALSAVMAVNDDPASYMYRSTFAHELGHVNGAMGVEIRTRVPAVIQPLVRWDSARSISWRRPCGHEVRTATRSWKVHRAVMMPSLLNGVRLITG
jgi:hypothetical protein